jgi:uncharacterized protein YjbI with pentapeptide repeats
MHANLAGTHMKAARLYHADLEGATLSDAYLADAGLAEANLRKADFSGANLYNAFLASAAMEQSDFRSAMLSTANLSRADLREANFADADLTGANFSEANLWRCVLQRADLRYVNFAKAKLDHCYFDEAKLESTILVQVNLADVIGLEDCYHSGPSAIDFSTLARSKDLPLRFLRGCGLPNSLIDYLPSLVNEPFQFYSCFISYSVKDADFAKRLHADLQDNGVRCWFAPEDMKIGDKIRDRIDQSIRVYDKLLIILSQNSIQSAWVEKEVETAFEKERGREDPVLFPIRLDEAVMKTSKPWAADIRRTRHIGDFRNWKDHDEYKKTLNVLIRDLRGKPPLNDDLPFTSDLDFDFDDDIPF